MLVGAGGHGCPVARLLNKAGHDGAPLVVAAETEYLAGEADRVCGERAELYVTRDLAGYGWCVRKGEHVNVGFGRVGGHALMPEARDFVSYARARRRIGDAMDRAWRAHAYLLSSSSHRGRIGDGVLLVGDAVGVAQPASGEGIGPAIETGLRAAAAIGRAQGDYREHRLRRYDAEIDRRLGRSRAADAVAAAAGRCFTRFLRPLVTNAWFARRVLLDAAFLRRKAHSYRSASIGSNFDALRAG
jgi:flavin-dependent dehydrogenase